MIVFLSYVIAFFLTLALAVLLYPVAAFFWVFEMIGKVLVVIFDAFGKVSDGMFRFTTKVIRRLWKDIRNIEKQPIPVISEDAWVCTCGTANVGNFCSACGSRKIIEAEVKVIPALEDDQDGDGVVEAETANDSAE